MPDAVVDKSERSGMGTDREKKREIASAAAAAALFQMQGEERISHVLPSSPPSSPPAGDIEPDSHENPGFSDSAAAAEPSNEISSSSSNPFCLSDDLREKIVRQVEYYFSDENCLKDKFLLKYVKKDKEGFVPIAVIASFRKMKKLSQDNSVVEAALRTSSQLIVSSDGKKVKRVHALPDTAIGDAKVLFEDAKSRTVLVENLPEDHSMENIQRIFGDAGNIKNICIREPHSIQTSTNANMVEKLIGSKAEKLISSKLHALVEYETVEAAEKAVASLNDEKNWRSGMRVELLLNRMIKYGLAPKRRKGAVFERSSHAVSDITGDGNNSSSSVCHDESPKEEIKCGLAPESQKDTAAEKNDHAVALDTVEDEKNLRSSIHHDETPEEEQEEHLPSEKAGWRGRYRGRGKSHRHHNVNGHGHGSVPGSGIEGPSKPPQGPRMPDGTRGFTMGRGKPPPSVPSDHQ